MADGETACIFDHCWQYIMRNMPVSPSLSKFVVRYITYTAPVRVCV